MTSPNRAVAGNMLNSSKSKRHSGGEGLQKKEVLQSNEIDEKGLLCIRRLDKTIGQNPAQRDADQQFLKKHYGEISAMEMHSYFASSDGAVRAALARRRI